MAWGVPARSRTVAPPHDAPEPRRTPGTMRMTTRIAAALSLIAALLVGALLYQLSVVERLQGVTLELSRTNLEAARTSVRLLQSTEGVREFAHKWWVLNDPEYAQHWEEWEDAARREVSLLSDIDVEGPGESGPVPADVGTLWESYEERSRAFRQGDSSIEEVDGALTALQDRVRRLMAVNDSAVAERAELATAAGGQARTVAWITTLAALAAAGLLGFLLFRSISAPLGRLTRGTRELARGRFEHRLEETGPTELAELASDFNEMAVRLGELEELKRDFVSHVSHELKSPLASIQETLDVLLEELPGPLEERQARLVASARRNSDRLSSLISELLEMSRLEAGAEAYRPGPHRLDELVSSVIQGLEALAEDRGVELTLRSDAASPAVVCDGDRVRDVVANLVDNAVKHSPEGGRVEVRLSDLDAVEELEPVDPSWRPPSEPGPFMLVSVKDQGPGVPVEEREAVFEKFHQVGGRGARRSGGVGLGLAIVRHLVEGHGGTVWVTDSREEGGGAIFRVLLPRLPSHWASADQEEAGSSTPQGSEPHPTNEAHPSSDTESVAATGGRRPDPEGNKRSPGPASLLIFLGLLSACASVPGFGDTDPQGSPPSTVGHELGSTPTVPVPLVAYFPTLIPSLDGLRIRRAERLMEEGAYREAHERYRDILQRPVSPRERSAALLGVGFLHLLPESPLHDLESARNHLREAAQTAPRSPAALQAGWTFQILEELEEVQSRVAEQDAVLRELNQALERLRAIDLDRRPSAPPPPPPDTLQL